MSGPGSSREILSRVRRIVEGGATFSAAATASGSGFDGLAARVERRLRVGVPSIPAGVDGVR
jgi:hypothetical protein